MALCSEHRFCTCDAYMKNSSSCTTHNTFSKYSYNERIEGDVDSSSVQCYGYSDSNCEDHKTNCHPDTAGYAYKCTVHRSYDASRVISISDCRIGGIIDNSQIAAI